MQVSIRIDETVKPIKQPYRRVPYHLTNKLRDKLKEFKDMDLIEDVDPGHVTRISPMVLQASLGWAHQDCCCLYREPTKALLGDF